MGALFGATLMVAILSWLFRKGKKRRRPIVAAGLAGGIAIAVSLFTVPDLSLSYAVGAIIVWAWMSIADRRTARAGGAAQQYAGGETPNEPPRQAPPHSVPDGAAQSAATNSWPQVLEVRSDASWAEIKAAYKRIASEYHPDKVATLPKGFYQFASEKMVAINEAFAAARKLHAASTQTDDSEKVGLRVEPEPLQWQPATRAQSPPARAAGDAGETAPSANAQQAEPSFNLNFQVIAGLALLTMVCAGVLLVLVNKLAEPAGRPPDSQPNAASGQSPAPGYVAVRDVRVTYLRKCGLTAEEIADQSFHWCLVFGIFNGTDHDLQRVAFNVDLRPVGEENTVRLSPDHGENWGGGPFVAGRNAVVILRGTTPRRLERAEPPIISGITF